MTTLQLFLQARPQLRLFEHHAASDAVRHNGLVYQQYTDEADSPLFYDWLEDGTGEICGIEIHVPSSHPINSSLRDKAYVYFQPYPQIFIRNVHSAGARGSEAFGDIELFRAPNNNWLLTVSLDGWLDERDVNVIRNIVNQDT